MKRRNSQNFHPFIQIFLACAGFYFFWHISISDTPLLIQVVGVIILIIGLLPITISTLSRIIWWHGLPKNINLPNYWQPKK